MKQFQLVVLAETVKIFSRLTGRFGLLFSALLGAAMPLMLLLFLNSGMVINGVESQDFFNHTPTDAVSWGLTLRNFLLVRAFLVVLGAQTLAGELNARTLRENLLRPVPRDMVVFAKWIALVLWDAVSLILTVGCSSILGAVMLGLDGYWVDILLATATNLACDAGLIAVVFAVAVFTRSTVATIAGLLVAMVLDKFLGWAMMAASTMAGAINSSPEIVRALDQWPILPSAAFGLWSTLLPDGEPDARSLASLLVLTAGGLLAAQLRLRRMEVP